MGNYNVYLPNYSVGAGCYSEIPKVARRLGNKAIVIGGRTAIDKAKQALLDGISGSDMKIIDFIVYGDDSTYENVDKLVNDERVKNADIIFGVGGGRAVDTTKVVADKLDKPLFTFPTLGSNCAAVTAICVMYNEDHTFKEYYYLEGPADHTFIDTQIIAKSPEDLFWAGIGDALSKECEAVYSSKGVNLAHTPLMGVGVSKICTEPLIKYGKKALEDCKNNQDSEELKQVALDIIISTGIVSNLTTTENDYYYNSSLAHAFYNGSTLVEGARGLHGEVVSFGVLTLLTCAGEIEKRNEIAAFNKSLGLPVCLADLGIDKSGIPTIVDKAVTLVEWNAIKDRVTKEMFAKAIADCDDYGMSLK